MRRPVLFAALLALAPLSSAVTLSLDTPFSVVRPRTGTKYFDITGTLYTGSPVSSASLIYSPAILTPTDRITDCSINGSIISGLGEGSFTGILFTLSIESTAALGTYEGAAYFKVRFNGGVRYSNVATFFLTIDEYAPPLVPEPFSVAALGIGVAAFIRRRR